MIHSGSPRATDPDPTSARGHDSQEGEQFASVRWSRSLNANLNQPQPLIDMIRRCYAHYLLKKLFTGSHERDPFRIFITTPSGNLLGCN